MTNYDMDAMQRRSEFAKDIIEHENQREKKSRSVEIGKDEESWTAIDVEIPDEDFIKLAHAAHTRDITINKMVNIILKSSMKDLDYRYEHNNKPQLLNEDN